MKKVSKVLIMALFLAGFPAMAHIGEDSGKSIVQVDVGGSGAVEGTVGGNGVVGATTSAEVKVEANVEQRERGGENGGSAVTENEEGEAKASAVSVSAVEVRGWDSKQKSEFLSSVKLHAQVQSEQDLENFATGVLLRDDNVEAAVADEEEVRVEYRVPAKFLGFISASLPVRASVDIESEAEEKVKVRFPWYRFLYNVDNDFTAGSLKSELSSELETELGSGLEAEATASAKAHVMEVLSGALRSKLEASAGATGSVSN